MTDQERMRERQAAVKPAKVRRPKRKPIPRWTGGLSN